MKDLASLLALLHSVKSLWQVTVLYHHFYFFSFDSVLLFLRVTVGLNVLLMTNVLSWSCHIYIFNGSPQEMFWKLCFFHIFAISNYLLLWKQKHLFWHSIFCA